jgi:hypothetical protein
MFSYNPLLQKNNNGLIPKSIVNKLYNSRKYKINKTIKL